MGVPRLQPMDATDTAAFREAERLLKAELGNLQDCPAPLVCHMTDGEYNQGGDPEPIAKRIMQMSVPDGNVLIENIFVTDKALTQPISDPKEWEGVTPETQLASPYAETLFRMSSPIPPTYRASWPRWAKLSPGRTCSSPATRRRSSKLGFAMSGATPVTPVSP